MNAIDAFAISMLAVIFTGFGVIALLFLSMARNGSRRDLELEKLMHDAVAENERQGQSLHPSRPAREAWARDEDWWKS
jgi:ABC-type lipoprotein release transport system permease subunit